MKRLEEVSIAADWSIPLARSMRGGISRKGWRHYAFLAVPDEGKRRGPLESSLTYGSVVARPHAARGGGRGQSSGLRP